MIFNISAQKKAAKEDKETNGTSDTESAQTPGCVDINKQQASTIFSKLQSGLRKNRQSDNKLAKHEGNGTTAPPAPPAPLANKPADELAGNIQTIYTPTSTSPRNASPPLPHQMPPQPPSPTPTLPQLLHDRPPTKLSPLKKSPSVALKAKPEVVYAELDLAPGGKTAHPPETPKPDPSEGTEYAQIVGILNNKDQKSE
ncbi:hypothetical protein FHG87_017695 [Trinorchestia longiramus]|nr:hypothetical protein FHG87_017695 [Trinorchestia longiramus]